MLVSHASLRACPVCGSVNDRMLCQLNYALFDDLDLSGTKKLLCCRTCGMLYDNVDFSEQDLSRYYASNEHYAASSQGGTGSSSEDNDQRYDRIIDQLQAESNDLILDYGCGQGGFLSRCRAHGLQAAGIEKSVASRRSAMKSGHYVYESLEQFSAQHTGQVYAVVFSHVLEHLLDPLQILRQTNGIFRKALFYLEVPDADAYLAPDEVRWNEMYFEHLNHFRRDSLYNMAANVPLDIVDQGRTTFSPELKDVACLTLLSRASNQEKKQTQTLMPNASKPFHFSLSMPLLDIPDGPVAIWGVSQYAMLLLGTHQELKIRTRRLFDSSPGKIGRSISGIAIEPTVELSTLSDEYNLVLPRSNYSRHMRELLHKIGFKGNVVEV